MNGFDDYVALIQDAPKGEQVAFLTGLYTASACLVLASRDDTQGEEYRAWAGGFAKAIGVIHARLAEHVGVVHPDPLAR